MLPRRAYAGLTEEDIPAWDPSFATVEKPRFLAERYESSYRYFLCLFTRLFRLDPDRRAA